MTLMIKKIEFDPEIQALEKQYIAYIRQYLGIVIHSHQSYELFKTIKTACEQFQCSPTEFLNKLLDNTNKSIFLDHLTAGITVGETYFFRDERQMSLLKEYLLPEIINKKRQQNSHLIRIWSAGCATGEEIYSIAILLQELLPDIKEWNLKLLATDINTHSLKKAISGHYSDWSMRGTSDYYKRKYFKSENQHFVILKDIKEMVNFEYLNLNDDCYPSIFNGTNSQDLIIFRNVLIYMDKKNCTAIMARLNKSLINGGYLMLGASDPIYISETDFIFHHKKGLLFSRPTEEELLAQLSFSKPAVITTPSHKKITLPKKTIIKKNITKEIKKYTSLNSNLNATELANQGKLIEAIKLCEDNFKKDPMNKLNYFTYGLAQVELNKYPEAEAAFRKSIYIDNQFVAGHYQLGLLLLRNKKGTAGLKCLQNALVIAESKSPEDDVPGSPGLCYKRLAEILSNEINLYSKMVT